MVQNLKLVRFSPHATKDKNKETYERRTGGSHLKPIKFHKRENGSRNRR